MIQEDKAEGYFPAVRWVVHRIIRSVHLDLIMRHIYMCIPVGKWSIDLYKFFCHIYV